MVIFEKECAWCKSSFRKAIYLTSKLWEIRKYCSNKCYSEYRHSQTIVSKNCERCRKSFFRGKVAWTQWKNRKYCSVNCLNLRMNPLAGSKTCLRCFKTFHRRVHGSSRERYEKWNNRMYCSVKCIKLSYKGGISPRYLKKLVLNRDNFTCIICGHREPDIMEVDHIKPKSTHPELKSELTNVVGCFLMK